MRTLGFWLLAVVLLASVPNDVLAQAGRFVPRFTPPPRVPVGPHILPHPVHGGRGRDDDRGWWIVGGLVALVIGAVAFSAWRRRKQQAQSQSMASASISPDDLILSADEVADKADRTARLLQWVGQRDPMLTPEFLRTWVTKVFHVVQRSWQDRNYEPLHDLLAPELAAKHQGLLHQMRAGGEINHIDGLRIDRLEFVHLRCPDAADEREFTALITFEAKVYFVGERTGQLTRGSQTPRLYQEFWTFRWQDDSWRLGQIEMSRESDRLHADNEVEGMTADQLQSC
jgi:predicted lipid-binding transport protein (Tim44 family)